MTIREEMELINACISRQSELYSEWARRQGMSYNTMMVLYALDREHARTQKEISSWWLMPKQTVHTVIKDLEGRGLVTLEAGRDQKEKRISFTPAGEQFTRLHLQGLYEMEERALAAMTPAARAGLVQGNRAFTEALEREVRRGSA